MKKDLRNAEIVTQKLGLILTRAINQRLEVTGEERQKKEEMVERWKTEARAAKRQRARGGMNLSSEEEENYESDTGDEINSYQVSNNKNSL